ncbi:unnamed protein product [Cuscuta campestris]|uniref:Uncharacterized protein n=1 Tax=Cuscuta campestris TaxID=132261 RepID=A0A484LKT1_9ASTE|nr:unnamed protein product [Cuscuta campestris]
MAEEDYEEEVLNVTLPATFETCLLQREPRKHSGEPSLAERVQVNLAVFMAKFFLLKGKIHRMTIQAGPFVTRLARSSSFVHLGTHTASSSGIKASILQNVLIEMRSMNMRIGNLETSARDARDVMETEFASHAKQLKSMNERLESNTEKLLGRDDARVFALDLPDTSASTSFTAPSAARFNGCLAGGQSHRTDQEGDGIQCAERGVETSASRDAIRGEEMDNGSSSVKDAIHSRPIRHPCHFLGVAKQAFLNCLGLDSSSESRKNRKHVKED